MPGVEGERSRAVCPESSVAVALSLIMPKRTGLRELEVRKLLFLHR